jgi:hypothetical protein
LGCTVNSCLQIAEQSLALSHRTINYSFGHPPSHFVKTQIVRGSTNASKKACEKGVFSNIAPARIPPCGPSSGRKSKSYTVIGLIMVVSFVS